MNAPRSFHSGYSPELTMELLVHGERFNVASLGPTNLIVRAPRPVKPGAGMVRMTVDGRVVVYHIELTDGIDPERLDHPLKLLSAVQEHAA